MLVSGLVVLGVGGVLFGLDARTERVTRVANLDLVKETLPHDKAQ